MYVDGYNFYYAIKNAPNLPIGLGWCDFRKLGEQFLEKGDESKKIRYFTTEVRWEIPRHEPGEIRRQENWLAAVQTIDGLERIDGRFSQHDSKPWEEKWTDVNIAVELLLDGLSDPGYDRAMLLTGD